MTPTADDLVAALGLPPEARVALRVPKKDLAEHAASTADRRLIQDGIESCTWVATLTPTTCGLAAVQDAQRNYAEIAVLVLHLRPGSPAARVRLRRLLLHAIPYPLVLIDAAPGSPAVLTLAHRRRSGGSGGTVLVDDLHSSDGLPWPPAALPALALAELAPADLYAAYDGWIGRLEALQAAVITGTWRPARTAVELARRRAALTRHAALAETTTAQARTVRRSAHLAQVVTANQALQAARQQQRALFPDLSLDPS